MEITNLQVYPIREPSGRLLAYVRVCLDDQLQLTGMKLYEGASGKFVSYPNDPTYQGEDYRQIFYPVTRELRDKIENAVVAEYRVAMGETSVATPKSEDIQITADLGD